jgi:hypothetical protein
MLASILILAISLVLFVYWFRYSCLLLLRDQPTGTVQDVRFSFAGVRSRLQQERELEPLQAALQRDYQVLVYLRRHAAGLGLESLEDRLLVLDYRLMRLWYHTTKVLAPLQARKALVEMASVLEILARNMGNRADSQAQA